MKFLPILILICALAFGLRTIDHSIHNIRGRPLLQNILVKNSKVSSSQITSSISEEIPSSILEQKFSYLSKGSQAYVFLSEDKQYVLKFYKLHIYEPSSFLAYLPFGPWHERWMYKKRKYASTLMSLDTAFKHFKEETGLLYVHLAPTNTLKKNVEVVDRRGKHQMVELDRALFVVQKKADLVYPYISQLLQNGKIEEAKNALSSIFAMLESLGRQGVTDNDMMIYKNCGFIEGRAAQIDIGKMRIEKTRIGSEVYKNDIYNTTLTLKNWIAKNHPELSPHFDELIRTKSKMDGQ